MSRLGIAAAGIAIAALGLAATPGPDIGSSSPRRDRKLKPGNPGAIPPSTETRQQRRAAERAARKAKGTADDR